MLLIFLKVHACLYVSHTSHFLCHCTPQKKKRNVGWESTFPFIYIELRGKHEDDAFFFVQIRNSMQQRERATLQKTNRSQIVITQTKHTQKKKKKSRR